MTDSRHSSASTRLRWLSLLAWLALLSLFVRAAQIMLLPDAQLDVRGHFGETLEVRGPRGQILDRNDRILAISVPLATLYADPQRIRERDVDLDALMPTLTELTGKSSSWLEEHLRAPSTREVRLATSLDPNQAEAALRDLPGDALWLRDELVRIYPHEDIGGPLLGTAGRSGQGLSGLERKLDEVLKGATVRFVRPSRASSQGVSHREHDLGGDTARLTLDLSIQAAAERALARLIDRSRPVRASAAVVDVETGAVLALASLEGPNAVTDAGSGSQPPRLGTLDLYEPGSILKPLVLATSLEQGVVALDTRLDCERGAWRVGRKTIRDEHPIGEASLAEIIKYSSNICAAKLGLALGPERLTAAFQSFGLGRPTGLNLPGETDGFLRDTTTATRSELAATAYGYGVAASPVQLAYAYASIANGGVRMSPWLLQAVLDRNGDVVQRFEPRVERRVLSKENAQAVSAMMRATTDKGGTGTRARVEGYTVAGKTSTTKKVIDGVYSATDVVGSFVGFLPATRPVVAIAVVVDSPSEGLRYGGWVAGPAFAEIGGYCMSRLGVPPDDVGHDSTSVVPTWTADRSQPLELRRDEQGRVYLPNLRGYPAREARRALLAAGVRVNVLGNGWVATQIPPAGTPLRPGGPGATLWAQASW